MINNTEIDWVLKSTLQEIKNSDAFSILSAKDMVIKKKTTNIV